MSHFHTYSKLDGRSRHRTRTPDGEEFGTDHIYPELFWPKLLERLTRYGYATRVDPRTTCEFDLPPELLLLLLAKVAGDPLRNLDDTVPINPHDIVRLEIETHAVLDLVESLEASLQFGGPTALRNRVEPKDVRRIAGLIEPAILVLLLEFDHDATRQLFAKRKPGLGHLLLHARRHNETHSVFRDAIKLADSGRPTQLDTPTEHLAAAIGDALELRNRAAHGIPDMRAAELLDKGRAVVVTLLAVIQANAEDLLVNHPDWLLRPTYEEELADHRALRPSDTQPLGRRWAVAVCVALFLGGLVLAWHLLN